ncbi:MAG: hypothetical protein JWP38_2804 [Herbaspirillum sp.]|nr:hypothetical protein [Herbaspirillum sp.]
MNFPNEQVALHFNNRLTTLVRCAAAYDAGDYAQATRLAGSIAKLTDDRPAVAEGQGDFISLATSFGGKPASMVDLSIKNVIDQPYLHGPVCIMGFHLAGAVGMVPLLDGLPAPELKQASMLEFDEWWTAPVLRDGAGNEMSRRKILQTMKNEEDAQTADALDGDIGILNVDLDPTHLDTNPLRVATRQIAHEVLRSFVPDFPPMFARTNNLPVEFIHLLEFLEYDEKGNSFQISNHKSVNIQFANTRDEHVWSFWNPAAGCAQGNNVKGMARPDPSVRPANPFRFRIVTMTLDPLNTDKVEAQVAVVKRTLEGETEPRSIYKITLRRNHGRR